MVINKEMRRTLLFPVLFFALVFVIADGVSGFPALLFFGIKNSHGTNCEVTPCFAKGFGGGSGSGFGASSGSSRSSKKNVKKSEAKKIQQKILKKYGTDVARGTQLRIEDAMKNLPPHLQVATQLYQKLQKWDAHLSTLSVLQQANLPPQEIDGARKAQEELKRLYKAHNFTEDDLHNVFQKITWDASADAKAARALTGNMPKEIADRVDRACEIVAEAVKNSALGPNKGRCLDVGCGFGVLVPHLTQFGLAPSQIYGVDLSTEMIRNAREQHRGVSFEAVDFLNEYQTKEDEKFDSIIFCSALHDLPDPMACLVKAGTLLQPGGKLVIVHTQGATHVLNQVKANPIMVKRGLPDADELRSLESQGLRLDTVPAEPGSGQDSSEGYLAVLIKNNI